MRILFIIFSTVFVYGCVSGKRVSSIPSHWLTPPANKLFSSETCKPIEQKKETLFCISGNLTSFNCQSTSTKGFSSCEAYGLINSEIKGSPLKEAKSILEKGEGAWATVSCEMKIKYQEAGFNYWFKEMTPGYGSVNVELSFKQPSTLTTIYLRNDSLSSSYRGVITKAGLDEFECEIFMPPQIKEVSKYGY